MYLGQVVGCVWSTVKNSEMEGQRFLVVQPITPDRKPTGRRLICTDSMGAGAGEIVYWVRGREASMPFLPRQVPADATIIAIVDSIHLKKPEASAVEPPAAGDDGLARGRAAAPLPDAQPRVAASAPKRARRGKAES